MESEYAPRVDRLRLCKPIPGRFPVYSGGGTHTKDLLEIRITQELGGSVYEARVDSIEKPFVYKWIGRFTS
jgi:hypothetical protein